jgi:hypothetical protein
MNKTQKKIIGWALILIGVLLVVVAVADNWPYMEFRRVGGNPRIPNSGTLTTFQGGGLMEMLKSWYLYPGLILGAAGAVVLKGENRQTVPKP